MLTPKRGQFGYRVVWLAPEKFRDYEQGLKERGQEVYKAARTKDHTERQRAARENKFGGGSSQDVGAGADADTPAEPAEPAGVQDVDMLDVGGPDEGETMVIDAANVVAELLEEGPAEQCARMSLLLLSPLGE